MNKSELIGEISENVKMSKRDVEYVLAATLDVITNAMIRGESVQLFGFGTFKVKDRAPRTGRNPKSGESIRIDASKAPISDRPRIETGCQKYSEISLIFFGYFSTSLYNFTFITEKLEKPHSLRSWIIADRVA